MIGGVDRDDLFQAVEAEQHDVVGEGAAGESRAGAAGDVADPALGEQPDDRDHLVARAGKNRERRLLPVAGKSVRFVDEELAHSREHVTLPNDVLEPSDHRVELHSET